MRTLILLALVMTAACGGRETTTPPPSPSRPAIASTSFALVPCASATAPNPCVLVIAGGKRVLFGTPSGAVADLTQSDLQNLDAVMLFSLRGEDIEGLDEVRNASWRAGHPSALRVSGPAGTAGVLAAINRAYETSDALTFVETPPAGGFNAAMLVPLPGESDTKARVFDTGDLVITHMVNDAGRAGYWIDYNGFRAVLEPCGMTQASHFSEDANLTVSCEGAEHAWPVQDVIFVDQIAAAERPAAP